MTALEQLGAFIANHQPDDRERDDVRLHVVDTVGAWIAARGSDEGRALLSFGKPDGGTADRLAINVALARSSEIDDIHLGSMITPGAIVVPAALMVAASLPERDASDLDAAIVAGYEAMIRLGAAIDGPSALYRGIWPTYFAAPFGVAATAARLFRLDATATAHALAIALIMAAPGVGQHAAVTTSRWLAAGFAAARGLQAARAAQAGFTADLKIAEGDFLKNVYAIAPNATLLAKGLGGSALSQVSFKPWRAARQTMAATQALKEIMAEGVTADNIARIGVAVLPPHQRMIDHGVLPGDRLSRLTSVQYQMALAALASDELAQSNEEIAPLSPALAAFMERIKVRPEESLLAAGYPQAWAAHVTVTTRTRRYERSVIHVPGDPARPFERDELRLKFMRAVAPVLDSERAASMFEVALGAVEAPAAVMRQVESVDGGQNP